MGNIFVIIAFVAYALVILGIGIFSYKKSKSMNDYFIGGRQLGSWTTAISAQASDMSGWLLMGLPGAIFVSGLTESWIAIGLFIGTYLNWKILAARLRKMSYAAGDAITIPEYFQKRFFTQNPIIRFACAAIIFVFFLIYTASAFSSGAKLFNYMFGTDYTLSLTIGALIIISYTFLGGFFAVCWTDLIQGLLMFAALVVVPLVCIIQTPDVSAVQFLNADGAVISNYLNLFENVNGDIAWTTILSGLAWGLGYFGMPHILLRFMAIEDEKKLVLSRRIATVWVVIAMAASIVIGMVGLGMTRAGALEFLSGSSSETLIVHIASLISQHGVLAAVLAGLILAGILAATMSTADSQMLAAASSVSQNILQEFGHLKLSEKQSLFAARLTIICVSVVGVVLARDPDSSVFGIVSFAWAGFGGSFGAVVLCALFWKRCNWQGALAGMLCGGLMVFVWKYIVSPLGGVFGIYELLPAFLVSLAVCAVVSLVTPAPTEDILAEFDAAK